MHIAAAHPIALAINQVDPSEVERERTIFREQALASGKPAEFVDKMVDGRLRKFYEEVVLEEQVFVIDGKTRVKDVVSNAAKSPASPSNLPDLSVSDWEKALKRLRLTLQRKWPLS